jgi:hypothetical protein
VTGLSEDRRRRLGLKLKLAEALPKSFKVLATYLKKAQLDLQTAILPNQVSISPTFYELLLCQNPFAKKLETQIVST